MRKITKGLVLLLTLLCMPVALIGGSAQQSSAKAEEPTTETIVVNDFEAPAKFNYFTMSNALGKVTMDTDNGGNTRACVYVQPDLFNGRMDAKVPGLFHSLKLQKEEKDYTNFRYVTQVKAKVYNAEDTEQEIGLQLVYTVKNRSLVTGKAQWYTLAPNAWTEITFDIGAKTIPVAYKKKAYGLNFVFKRPTKNQSGYTLYIDDLALQKKIV